MNPRVTEVLPLQKCKLEIKFDNSEVREVDVYPYLENGIFKELKDLVYFIQAFVLDDKWLNRQDFCPDTVFEESKVMVSQ